MTAWLPTIIYVFMASLYCHSHKTIIIWSLCNCTSLNFRVLIHPTKRTGSVTLCFSRAKLVAKSTKQQNTQMRKFTISFLHLKTYMCQNGWAEVGRLTLIKVKSKYVLTKTFKLFITNYLFLWWYNRIPITYKF